MRVVTCSGVAVGGHSRVAARPPGRARPPVAVSRHFRQSFDAQRGVFAFERQPNPYAIKPYPTHPINGPAVRRMPFFFNGLFFDAFTLRFFFFIVRTVIESRNALWTDLERESATDTNSTLKLF